MLKLFFALSVVASPLLAQAPGVPIQLPGYNATASPYGFTIKRISNLDTAPIAFEGHHLFDIAAPVGAPDAVVPPIVQRVDTITDNLHRIVPAVSGFGQVQPTSRFDAKTFKVNVGSENGYPTLYATDAAKRDVAPIMTLTDADATLNGMSNSELALRWQHVLQTALGHALLASEPEYLTAQLRKLPWIVGGAILATLLITVLRRRLRRRHNALEAAAGRLDPDETSDASSAKRLRFQRSMVSGALWLSSWATFTIWALVVVWTLGILPATRVFAYELGNRLLRVVLLWLGIAILDRLLNVVIVRIADRWNLAFFASPEERARLTVRRPTFVRAAENLKSIVLWAIAILATLTVLSVSATSVLTIGAVIIFALSFAAQSLIKDYLNGFLILAEDQFAIGDYVNISGFSGSVEDLTLRITKVRTDDGRLVTIPNSSILAVENKTRLWSRIDYRIVVSASSDIERTIAVLKAVLDEIAADPVWGKKIQEPPEILGVDSLSHAGIVLRAWIKTVPTQREAVAREINRRLSEALRQENIALGVPQSILVSGEGAERKESPTHLDPPADNVSGG